MKEQNKLITTDHETVIKKHIKNAKKSIKIISPFISFKSLDFINETNADITIITRFDISDFIQGASNIKCLLELLNYTNVSIFALKDLHTKLYLFDDDSAILGSANFTDNGLNKNIELSIEITEAETTRELNQYFNDKLSIAQNYVITKELILEYIQKYDICTEKVKKIQTEKFDDIFTGNVEDEGYFDYELIHTRALSDKSPNPDSQIYIILGDNKPIKCKNQKDVLSNFLRKIDELYPYQLSRIVEDLNINNISSNTFKLRSPRIITKDIAIETNMDWKRKINIIKKVLKSLGLPDSYFRFCDKDLGDIIIKDKNKTSNNNRHNKIQINSDNLSRLNNIIEQSILKLKQYKLSGIKHFANLVKEDITLHNYVDLVYYKKLTSGPIITQIKQQRGTKNHLDKFIFTLIQQDIFNEIENFNSKINTLLKDYNIVSFDNTDIINFDILAALEENFPNCNFIIDKKNKCFIKKDNIL